MTYSVKRFLDRLDFHIKCGRTYFTGGLPTRNRKVISIRSFLTFLHQDQYINANLAKRVIPPFVESKTPHFLTKAEYERLLEASAKNPRYFALIQLLLQTGLKPAELTRLTLNDVELPTSLKLESRNNGYLRVSGGERQKARVLPLNYKASLAIDAYIKSRSEQSKSALFINRFGEQLSARGVEKIINNKIYFTGPRAYKQGIAE